MKAKQLLKEIDNNDMRLWSAYNGTLVLLCSYTESLLRQVDKQKTELQAMDEDYTFDLIIKGDRAKNCNDIDFIIEKIENIADQLKHLKEIKLKAEQLAYDYHKTWVDQSIEEGSK